MFGAFIVFPFASFSEHQPLVRGYTSGWLCVVVVGMADLHRFVQAISELHIPSVQPYEVVPLQRAYLFYPNHSTLLVQYSYDVCVRS
jgi:hypothetical protein